MNRSEILKPNSNSFVKAGIQGDIMNNTISFSPSEAKPEQKITVQVPKLSGNDLCIIPDTMYLVFNFKNSNTKSRFLNNLSRLLVEQLQVTFAGEVVYDNTKESTLNLYKDKWVSDDKKRNVAMWYC